MNERRAQVLDLVTRHYIRAAHPVASAQIAKRLAVSSATVRHELSALEEQGYLQQPHTSAGRIPTAQAYRHYAGKFVPPKALPQAQRQLLEQRLRGSHGEHLLQQIAGISAELSGYAVVVRLPADDSLCALEIHLSALSSSKLLAVVVLENGLTRQVVVELDPTPKDAVLREAESSLRRLALPIGILPKALQDLAKHVEDDTARTLQALAAAWHHVTPATVFSRGLGNVLSEPESHDPSFVRSVVSRLEDPQLLASADVQQALAVILEEALALVSAQLELGNSQATLMLLGPMRMRYPETLMLARGVRDTVASSLN